MCLPIRFLPAAFACLSASQLSAAIISATPAPLVSGAGTASVLVVTGTPNNDNVTVPGGTITVTGKNFTGVGAIDIVFPIATSGGTTEYFVSEGITNSTGVAWTGYLLELGFGTGANFVRSDDFDLLDFDTPPRDPTPTFASFAALVHNSNDLTWSGGPGVPHQGATATTFSIDIPDNLGVANFTLRQTPLVPEPTSLLALSGLALAARRARRA